MNSFFWITFNKPTGKFNKHTNGKPGWPSTYIKSFIKSKFRIWKECWNFSLYFIKNSFKDNQPAYVSNKIEATSDFNFNITFPFPEGKETFIRLLNNIWLFNLLMHVCASCNFGTFINAWRLFSLPCPVIITEFTLLCSLTKEESLRLISLILTLSSRFVTNISTPLLFGQVDVGLGINGGGKFKGYILFPAKNFWDINFWFTFTILFGLSKLISLWVKALLELLTADSWKTGDKFWSWFPFFFCLIFENFSSPTNVIVIKFLDFSSSTFWLFALFGLGIFRSINAGACFKDFTFVEESFNDLLTNLLLPELFFFLTL